MTPSEHWNIHLLNWLLGYWIFKIQVEWSSIIQTNIYMLTTINCKRLAAKMSYLLLIVVTRSGPCFAFHNLWSIYNTVHVSCWGSSHASSSNYSGVGWRWPCRGSSRCVRDCLRCSATRTRLDWVWTQQLLGWFYLIIAWKLDLVRDINNGKKEFWHINL